MNGLWLRFVMDADTKSPVVFFAYPCTQLLGFDYVRQAVKLEFASLTDQQPTETHQVLPLLAQSYEGLFVDWQCQVLVLALELRFGKKPRYCTPNFIGLQSR